MTKVNAYMATFEGREIPLLDAVASIATQVDTLNIWVNNYPIAKREQFEQSLSAFTNVTITYSDIYRSGEAGNIGDIGKFWFMDEWEGYIFTVDDTWIYPVDYVSCMIQAIERYNHKAVISVHGRLMKGEIKSYYHFKESELFLYNNVYLDAPCNEIGTGVMALHSDMFKDLEFDLSMFKHTNMTDIYFSMELNSAGIPCVIIAHDRAWIAYNPKSTGIRRISATCLRNETLQVEVCNSHNWKLIPVN
jgi:hypothetical protein